MPLVSVIPCRQGDILPLSPAPVPGMAVHTTRVVPPCRVGDVFAQDERPMFRVVGMARLPHLASVPHQQGPYAYESLLLEALCDQQGGEHQLSTTRPQGWALAWITLSDKGARGERLDESGPLMASMVRASLPLRFEQGFLIPDDPHRLRALVTDMALTQGYDLLLTSGGTGLGPRDSTPETLLPLFEKRLEGFEQAMMLQSLAITPRAAISRAVAGTLGRSLIISLPGSRKAVAENLAAVLPALAHALEKLHGEPGDCGSPPAGV